jgi:transposase
VDDVEKYCPDALWHLAQPLLPPHPQRHQGGGRKRTEDRAMLATIVYVLESGCSWRKLPGSFPMHWRTAHRRFAEWVGGRGDDWFAPGEAGSARARRADRLVSREHRQHARTGAQKGNLTGPSPVDRDKSSMALNRSCRSPVSARPQADTSGPRFEGPPGSNQTCIGSTIVQVLQSFTLVPKIQHVTSVLVQPPAML